MSRMSTAITPHWCSHALMKNWKYSLFTSTPITEGSTISGAAMKTISYSVSNEFARHEEGGLGQSPTEGSKSTVPKPNDHHSTEDVSEEAVPIDLSSANGARRTLHLMKEEVGGAVERAKEGKIGAAEELEGLEMGMQAVKLAVERSEAEEGAE